MSIRVDMGSEKEMRLLVVGKTGNGKSALCNTILGRNEFATGHSMSSTTVQARKAKAFREGFTLEVVDTPDVSNLDMTQRQTEDEVAKWMSYTSTKPTAILLAVRCDVRYTAEEYAVYQQVCKLLEHNFVKSRLVVAFTFGDRQDGDIEKELRTVCPELKKVLNDAKGRYVVFDNTANDFRKGSMVQELLMKVLRIPGEGHLDNIVGFTVGFTVLFIKTHYKRLALVLLIVLFVVYVVYMLYVILIWAWYDSNGHAPTALDGTPVGYPQDVDSARTHDEIRPDNDSSMVKPAKPETGGA